MWKCLPPFCRVFCPPSSHVFSVNQTVKRKKYIYRRRQFSIRIQTCLPVNSENDTRIMTVLFEFVILSRLFILRGRKSKQLCKNHCIVDPDIFKRDTACLLLMRGLFSIDDRISSISQSRIRVLLLPFCVTNFYSQEIVLAHIGSCNLSEGSSW